jgi:hypothetical protein
MVRRVLGYMSFVLGLTLVFLVPFLLLYAVPRIQKAPTDTDQRVVSNGYANHFSATQLQLVGPDPVQNIEVLKGDLESSTETVAVIHYTSQLVNRTTGTPIDFDQETYALDRTTGVAEHCCGEDPKMTGETLKFPFGTQKTTYQLWDPSANASFAVRYVRTDDLQGVTAYVFQGTSSDINIGTIDLPNSLVGVEGRGLTSEQRMFQAETTVWVEPSTGQVLKGEKHLHQWAADASGTTLLELADVHVQYSDATVSDFVSQADTNVKQLKLVKQYIPLYGGVLGFLLATGGLLLLRSPGARTRKDALAAAAA